MVYAWLELAIAARTCPGALRIQGLQVIATSLMQLFSPAINLNSPVGLGLGPGPGARLLSTGLPDQWVPFGQGLAFIDAQGLVVLQPEGAHWLPLPAEALALSPWSDTHLAVLMEGPSGMAWLAVGLQGAPLPPPEDRSWFALGPRRLVEPLARGAAGEPWVPDGAIGALASPLWGRGGLGWMDGRTLYRGPPRLARVAGSTDFDPIQLHPGPNGALLILGEEAWALAPPKAPPVTFEGQILEEGFRFVSEGKGLVARTEEGLARFEASPQTRVVLEGEDSLPLGSEQEPWWLDLEGGLLRSASAPPCLKGVFATAWAHHEELMVGPGAGIWNAGTGELLTHDPGLCGDQIQIGAEAIFVVIEGCVRSYSREGVFLGEEECVEVPSDSSGPCTIKTRGGIWHLGWDGLAIWIPV